MSYFSNKYFKPFPNPRTHSPRNLTPNFFLPIFDKFAGVSLEYLHFRRRTSKKSNEYQNMVVYLFSLTFPFYLEYFWLHNTPSRQTAKQWTCMQEKWVLLPRDPSKILQCLPNSIFQSITIDILRFLVVGRSPASCSLLCACCGHNSCIRWRSIARPCLKPSLMQKTRKCRVLHTTNGSTASSQMRCEPHSNRMKQHLFEN